MKTKVGQGDFVYEVIMDWARLPEGWSFHEVVDVAVDSRDQVYVFSRGEHPVTIFDREGRFLDSWGEGLFQRPHGMTLGPDGCLYITDDLAHVVQKYTPDGRLLMSLGTAGAAAPFQSGEPFNRPTKVAFDPEADHLYVADGYGNSRVHKYSKDGEYLFSWGAPGSDPAEFNLVHSVCTDEAGRIYVADRENHRIQIFDAQGGFQEQWHNLHRPCALHIGGPDRSLIFVGEIGPQMPINADFPNLGPRIGIYSPAGERLARLGDRRWGEEAHQFIAPHGIAVDSHGDIYLGEVSYSFIGRTLDPPREMRSFRKLIRI
jgi:hypothetical protein